MKIYWKPVKLLVMTNATALKFPVAPGSLELTKRDGNNFVFSKDTKNFISRYLVCLTLLFRNIFHFNNL